MSKLGFSGPPISGLALIYKRLLNVGGYPWAIGRKDKSENVKVVITLILDVQKDAVGFKLMPCA